MQDTFCSITICKRSEYWTIAVADLDEKTFEGEISVPAPGPDVDQTQEDLDGSPIDSILYCNTLEEVEEIMNSKSLTWDCIMKDNR